MDKKLTAKEKLKVIFEKLKDKKLLATVIIGEILLVTIMWVYFHFVNTPTKRWYGFFIVTAAYYFFRRKYQQKYKYPTTQN